MIAFLSISEAVTPPAPISSERTTSTHEGIITMTTTGEDTRPLPLIGQAVGQAQASLTRLLTGILAGSGTSHLLWHAAAPFLAGAPACYASGYQAR